MKKLQPIHRFAAYILCGIVLAIALGFLLKSEPSSDLSAPKTSHEIVKVEREDMPQADDAALAVIEEDVSAGTEEVIDITEENIEGNEHVMAEDADTAETEFDWNEMVWDNPLSIFSLQALSEMDDKADLSAVEEKALPAIKGRIAIIIDDMGIDMKHSYALMDMKGPFTLSFLPYAKNIDSQTEFARKKHHSLMIHMPMEAVSGVMMETPGLLKAASSSDSFTDQLEFNLSKMHGYTGLNNHMGSLLTQDEDKMKILMKVLKSEGVYFIDSRTINTSVAADVAKQEGVPFLVRDVFLDHDPRHEAILASLERAEQIAAEKGIAIAIGHPKQETVDVLREWAPKLREKGYELVTVDQLIQETYPKFSLKEDDNFSLMAAPHQSHITALSIFD